MRGFRRHFALGIAAWFIVQAGALAATPMAAFELSIAAEGQLPECCRNLKPGQTCPMHQHPGGEAADQACHLASACAPLDVALLSLATGIGLPPAPAVAAAVMPPAVPVHAARPQPVTRAAAPEPPPPRA
jgi:hypothetical protein